MRPLILQPSVAEFYPPFHYPIFPFVENKAENSSGAWRGVESAFRKALAANAICVVAKCQAWSGGVAATWNSETHGHG